MYQLGIIKLLNVAFWGVFIGGVGYLVCSLMNIDVQALIALIP